MISNRIVWVTGASTGIGRAVVTLLVEQNNTVVISARNKTALDELAEHNPGRIITCPCDVTNEVEMAEASNLIAEKIDHIDVLIACAGTCEYQDGPKCDINMYKRVFDANFFGVINTLNVALPFLQASSVVAQVAVVSSLSSLLALPRAEAYGASKAAIDYFIKAYQMNFKPSEMKFSIVRPGFVDTPLTQKNDFDMPFLLKPEAAAKEILDGIAKQKDVIEFPKKLSIPMNLLTLFPKLWLNIFAPRLKKQEAL